MFLTVGTTSFDELVAAVASSEVARVLVRHGFSDAVLQLGGTGSPPAALPLALAAPAARAAGIVAEARRGSPSPPRAGGGDGVAVRKWGVAWRGYRLKASTADDLRAAHLVVAHAGAGSAFDALRQDAHRPLVLVPNPALQGNHQTELARALDGLGVAVAMTRTLTAAALADAISEALTTAEEERGRPCPCRDGKGPCTRLSRRAERPGEGGVARIVACETQSAGDASTGACSLM